MDTAADRGPQGLPPGAFSAAPGPPIDPAAPDAAAAHAAHETSAFEPFERVVSTLKRMASNYATLAVLDARRAAVQFAWLVAGGIFIAVLIVTAWLAAIVALCVWLFASGLSWPAVLLIAAAANLVGAAIVALWLRSVFDRVPFEATLRQLKAEDVKRA
jgi:hypothetical protein